MGDGEEKNMGTDKTAAYSETDNNTDRGDCRERQLNNSYRF